jgi:hypothetical protein
VYGTRARSHKGKLARRKGRKIKGQEKELIDGKAFQQIRKYFPKARRNPRVDDRRVISGIVYVSRNEFERWDAPKGYGSP